MCRILCSFVVMAVVIGCAQSLTSSDESKTALAPRAGFYTVDDFDPTRDAQADLIATVDHATAENKRIILEVGGQW